MTSELQAVKQIPWVRVDDQSIIADPTQNNLVLLNQSATIIWHALRSGQNSSEISHQLKETYQISSAQATTDVKSMINQWRQSGLLNEDTNKFKSKRWLKEKQLGSTNLIDKKPLHHIVYQLNTHIFVVEYFQDKAYDCVHAVLSHLQVDINIDDSRLADIQRYQISHDGKYQLLESTKKTHLFYSLDELVEVFQWTLIERAYQNSDWLTVLHSAALGVENKQAIVFIAQRGSGKSTLSHILQDHGFIYLADDVVPLNFNGELQPMPMCQRFKQGSWKALKIEDSSHNKTYARQEGYFVKYVKPLTGSRKDWAKNWPVKAIVYPQFNPGLKHYQFKKLNNIEAMAKLCNSGSVFGGAIDQSQLKSIISWNNSTASYSLYYSQVNTQVIDQIISLTK